MLEFILYLVFSVLETSALIFLGFKIFKIDLYLKEIFFVSLILAFFSYIVRIDYKLVQLDIIIQYILLLCFLWLMFRIHIFYAVIMAGMAYQAYSFIQTVYIYLIKFFVSFTSIDLYGSNLNAYIMQALSAVTAVLIGIYIGHKRKGFDFVPDKPNGTINLSLRDKILFALNLPTIGIMISIAIFVSWKFFSLIPLAYGFILYGYLYFSYRRDRNNYEYFKL
ncbi:hypothetical protein [Paenibacillus rhizophilus]|uniref:Uncharacterized protein n=1 Tax=Paenibacillus rhizophilus TaxID=1850366 RepID=A0A3N9P0R1_9BACL|nr:hypothetical protein [Paenibacillus rhizophilus]RQW08724.1 hypothetical protein EH198_21470 [Paenibacillus rhizophilus]